MTVKECENFVADFPETFIWSQIESLLLTNVAHDICNRIAHSLRADPARLEVPGLRAALRVIAQFAEV